MASSESTLLTLAEELAAQMRQCWQAGERPATEDYLALYPALRDHPEATAELIYEEVCLRRESGEQGCSSAVLRRFPQWESQLRLLLEFHGLLEGEGEPDYPGVEEVLGEFHLLAELGRGLHGRVYLARQSSLAGRPVVVKVTPRQAAEHLSLARLQHTHIVPLYAAYDDPERNLRVLCLPFFGGASLAAVLANLEPVPPAQRTARDLWQALEAAQGSAPGLLPSLSPPGRLVRASYVEVVCWIGACLAEALAYAHERGLVHLDVKPSNVLLTAEGQPMLLDFHLAREPLPAGAPAPAWLGGTPGYLSPEQSAALEAVRCGGTVAGEVDGRSDVYSLGLVLYEALGGTLRSEGGPPLRTLNRNVGTGLSDLVARCLSARPEDRYPDALALADDLRRHLSHLPLRGVGNRDFSERWRKWRRRRPGALGLLGLLLVLLTGAGLLTGFTLHQRGQARAALEEGNQELSQGRPAAARAAFQRGQALVGGLPLHGELEGALAQGLGRAARAEAALELHSVTDRLRGLYGDDPPPDEELARAEQLARQFWDQRSAILTALGADLPRAAQQQVRTDLLELAILWSHLRVRLAPPGAAPGRHRLALHVLRELERVVGPSVVLSHERAWHAARLGRDEQAREAREQAERQEARSPWEHYALGCFHLRGGEPARACAELEQAVQQQPHSFWANFYHGRCCLQLRRHDEAVLAFSVCVALRPDSAASYLHRATAYANAGSADKALRDVERALDLDPSLASARALRQQLRRGR